MTLEAAKRGGDFANDQYDSQKEGRSHDHIGRVVHVEVALDERSYWASPLIKHADKVHGSHHHQQQQQERMQSDILALLMAHCRGLFLPCEINLDDWNRPSSSAARIRCIHLTAETGECKRTEREWDEDTSPVCFSSPDQIQWIFHFYTLHEDENSNDTDEHEEDEEDSISSHSQTLTSYFTLHLPHVTLNGLWDKLVFDSDIQSRLLRYIGTALSFADHGVDSSIIGINRVALISGPPGTGKTTLCRALAQKAAIRLSHRYSSAKLVQINASALFSKFFSESAKLVSQTFTQLRALIADPSCFLCVLIDEVESVSLSRGATMSGNEPSDAIRVVNTLLTEVDKLRRHSNVLILATTNLPDAVDPAFLDRVDLRQQIGVPSHAARYTILRSCLLELMEKRLLSPTRLKDHVEVQLLHRVAGTGSGDFSFRLWALTEQVEGWSGRALRKFPFMAYAFFLPSPRPGVPASLEAYWRAMEEAVLDAQLNGSQA